LGWFPLLLLLDWRVG